jgi:hypothetical protein
MCLAIASMVLASACGRAASVKEGQRVPAQAIKIDDVHFRMIDSELTVQYRTPTPSRDCKAQAAEMPKVWEMVVKDRLRDSPAERVVLSPEDGSGQSLGIQFAKNASGQWSAAAPCLISIPVN